jgi:hypothetical protein
MEHNYQVYNSREDKSLPAGMWNNPILAATKMVDHYIDNLKELTALKLDWGHALPAATIK